jgi:hypothetical protein
MNLSEFLFFDEVVPSITFSVVFKQKLQRFGKNFPAKINDLR